MRNVVVLPAVKRALTHVEIQPAHRRDRVEVLRNAFQDDGIHVGKSLRTSRVA
jgi:hypothetical protein